MRFYNFFLNILFIISFPFLYIFKRREFLLRTFSPLPHASRSIWIHAASVGEINAAKTFIKALSYKYPNKKIVISVMTKTGLEIAKNISPDIDAFIYRLDINFLVNNIFKAINPEIILIMETEIWPNMLYIAKKHNIPVLIINGRITQKSFNRYTKTLFFRKKVIPNITAAGLQTEDDAKRYKKIGLNNAIVTNNLKYSVELPAYNNDNVRSEWQFSANDFIIVLGSSRPGEEELLKSMLPKLMNNISKLKIIVCPRHLKRIEEVKSIFEDFVLLSEIDDKPHKVLIIDKMGVLTKAYSIADIAIVGGSFYDFGGHNPLEPAFYKKAIIIGNYHSSCADSVEKLKSKEAILISNAKSLANDILNLSENTKLRKKMGENAKEILKMNQDSLSKNLKFVEKYLKIL